MRRQRQHGRRRNQQCRTVRRSSLDRVYRQTAGRTGLVFNNEGAFFVLLQLLRDNASHGVKPTPRLKTNQQLGDPRLRKSQPTYAESGPCGSRRGKRQHQTPCNHSVVSSIPLFTDRKSVVYGNSVSVRVTLDGRRIIKKKKK